VPIMKNCKKIVLVWTFHNEQSIFIFISQHKLHVAEPQ